MPEITHSQAIEAHAALLALAQLENIPAIPTGMAIRRGARLLATIADDVEQERKKLIEKYIEKDENGKRVVAETYPDGSAKAWKLTDGDGYNREYKELYGARVKIDWTIPESIFAGITAPPALFIALGDLLTENERGG